MDEQPIAASTAAASAAHQPETLAELAQTPLPATATPSAKASTKSGPSTKKPTPQNLVNQASAQMDLLRQAETIKQLQGQVRLLEGQSVEAGRVFLGTITTLITSAFALVAALAWNDAIQSLFKQIFPPNQEGNSGWGLIASAFGYALFITIIVVIVIFYLTRLSKRFGGTSLIGEAPKGEGAKKE
jgi:predicted PurR-regulated permease PerM